MPNKYLPLLLLFVSLASQGGTLFKWVDENGATHYTESPPENQKSKEVEIRPTKPSDDNAQVTHYVVGLPANQNLRQSSQSIPTPAEDNKSGTTTAVSIRQLRERKFEMPRINQKTAEHREELMRTAANRQSTRVVSPTNGTGRAVPRTWPSYRR